MGGCVQLWWVRRGRGCALLAVPWPCSPWFCGCAWQVLGFIGAKMLLEFVDVEVPTDVSLLVVGLVLSGGVAASMLLPETDEAREIE